MAKQERLVDAVGEEVKERITEFFDAAAKAIAGHFRGSSSSGGSSGGRGSDTRDESRRDDCHCP